MFDQLLNEALDEPYELTRVTPKVSYVFDEWEFEIGSQVHVVRFTYAPYFGKRVVNVDAGIRNGTKIRRKFEQVPNIRKYLATILKAVQEAQADPTPKMANRRDGMVLLVPEKVFAKTGSRFVRLARILLRKTNSVTDAINTPPEGEQSGMNTIFVWKRGRSFKNVFTSVADKLENDIIEPEVEAEVSTVTVSAPVEPVLKIDDPIEVPGDPEMIADLQDTPHLFADTGDIPLVDTGVAAWLESNPLSVHAEQMIKNTEWMTDEYIMGTKEIRMTFDVDGNRHILNQPDLLKEKDIEFYEQTAFDPSFLNNLKHERSAYRLANAFHANIRPYETRVYRLFFDRSLTVNGEGDVPSSEVLDILFPGAQGKVDYDAMAMSWFSSLKIDDLKKFLVKNKFDGDPLFIDSRFVTNTYYETPETEVAAEVLLKRGLSSITPEIVSLRPLVVKKDNGFTDYSVELPELTGYFRKFSKITSEIWNANQMFDRLRDKVSAEEIYNLLPEVAKPVFMTSNVEAVKTQFWDHWALSGNGFTQMLASTLGGSVGPNAGTEVNYYVSKWIREQNEDAAVSSIIMDPKKNTAMISALQGMYEQTQEYLKNHKKWSKVYNGGEGTIKLYRGIFAREYHGKSLNNFTYTPAGFESWTTAVSTANSFSGDKNGIILEADVPFKYLFATFESAAGFFPPEKNVRGKKEHMVMGSAFTEIQIRARRRGDTEGRHVVSNVSAINESSGDYVKVKIGPGGYGGAEDSDIYYHSSEYKNEPQTKKWITSIAGEIQATPRGKTWNGNNIPSFIVTSAIEYLGNRISVSRRGNKVTIA